MDVGALDIEIEKVESSRLSETDFSNLTFGREFSDHMLVAILRMVNGRDLKYNHLRKLLCHLLHVYFTMGKQFLKA